MKITEILMAITAICYVLYWFYSLNLRNQYLENLDIRKKIDKHFWIVSVLAFCSLLFFANIVPNISFFKNIERQQAFVEQVEIYNQVENAAFKNGNWFIQFTDQDDLVVYSEDEIPDDVLDQIVDMNR